MLPQDMGYVVLEPRVDAAHSREEHAKFEDALHDYRTALTRAKRSLLKMRVLPPEAALPDIKAIVDGVAKRAVESRDVLGNDLGRDVTGAVRQAIDRNGFFTQSDMVVAGGSGGGASGPPKPPQGFEGAFASFERGGGGSGNSGGGSGGTFRLFPGHGGDWDSTARDRWREGPRLDFLRQAILPVPLEESGRKGLVARKVTFFQDPNSKVVFVSVFDRDQNAYYFYQSDGSLDGLAFLALPPARSETEIHFRQAELLLRIWEGNHRG
ncbi:hypothetical protein RA210_U600002 [Rubrivivax sp. A210]|uniref:hypothetical protein n=1 Tax=Rubrivivax sp. A210 TaxID=2772301 RepID=UPI00191AB5C8|nr:hypothetical protein [Rubrivivax sp. A210]CAD5374667.1 hypothetical protein RA210_U600002 [Rubrivivax sp. A210]